MQRRLTIPKQHTVQTILQMVSVLYLMIWSVAPPLQMDMIFRLLALGLAFVWFLIEFFRRFEFTRMQIWCALYMAAIAILAFFSGGFSGVIGQIAVYMMVLAFFINVYSADSWQDYRIVVPVTLILLIFFNVKTATELAKDASIARQLVRDTEELYEYMRRGIGGYGLVYPQVCIAPVVFAWTLRSFEQHKFCFLLGAVWTGTFFWLLNGAGYSIAIIATVAPLFILFFYRKYSIWPALVITIFLILLGIWLLVYSEGFRNVALRIFEGTKVVRKIEDLLSTAEGETADSFATRMERYWWSLRTCLQFPLIGGSMFGGQIGGHSELLDTFARYGVWGGIPTAYMIFYTPHSFKISVEYSAVISTANAHITAIALVSFFDPFVYQVYFPLLILCPILYTDIIKWSGEKI